MTTMSKVDIIKDTVRYYCNHRRAIDKVTDECVYFDTSMKARCAIGRFSISEELDKFQGDILDFAYDYAPEGADNIDEFLDPKVRGHGLSFWHDVQSLHDSAICWKISQPGRAGKELTEEGQEYYEKLLEKYGSEARS